MIAGRAILLVCALSAALLAASTGAGAQDERSKPKPPTAPLPPTRPSKLGEPTGTLPHVIDQPPRRTVVIVQVPHDLPVASRARMHDCGAQWQRMKMAGTAVDKTWRVFAQSCLVSQTP